MRSSLLRSVCGLLSLALVGCATAPRQTARDAEAEILRLQDEWRLAYIRQDTAALGALLAEDYSVMTEGTGSVRRNRAEALRAAIVPPTAPFFIQDYVLDDVSVRMSGDSAVVTGIATVHRANKQTKVPTEFPRSRFVHVWIKRDGRWQLVTRDATPLGNE